MLKRVLIANRGEIALRVLRACREMGIETVAAYSAADAEELVVQLATRAVCIGPARAAESYLCEDALLTAALATGCDAIHPGYGFLSENADFADACAAAGLTFIGPSGDTIRKAGSKSAARDLMRAAGVPVTPGSDGAVATVDAALRAAETVGYPVLVKASAGGGGRGIRRCDRAENLPAAYAAAQAEARACFGSEELYLEKLVLHPRHIEFQILADRHGQYHSSGRPGLLGAAPEPEADGRGSRPLSDAGTAAKRWARQRFARRRPCTMRARAPWNFCWIRTESISTSWR